MSTKPTGRAPQILRFTTHGLSPKNRVQLWEGHNSRALIPLDIRTIEDSPLRAQQTNLNLPSIRMADVFGTSQIVERSETFINDHPTGVVAVFFATEGEAFFFHRGGHISLGPGQAIVYDADRPFVRGFSRGFRELVLTIPRQLYEDLLGPGGPDLPAVFDFGPGAGASEQALARRLQHALAVASAPGLETDPTARHSARMELAQAEEDTLGLLQLILASPGSSPTGVVAAATDFIERHLTDPDLPPSRVAEALASANATWGDCLRTQALRSAASSRPADSNSPGSFSPPRTMAGYLWLKLPPTADSPLTVISGGCSVNASDSPLCSGGKNPSAATWIFEWGSSTTRTMISATLQWCSPILDRRGHLLTSPGRDCHRSFSSIVTPDTFVWNGDTEASTSTRSTAPHR